MNLDKSNLGKNFPLVFFDNLNKLKVDYCILGKSFSKFDKNHQGDIDIAINKKDIDRAKNLIFHLTKNTNFYLLKDIQHEINSNYYIIFENNKEYKILHRIDICTDYVRKCKIILKDKFLLSKTKNVVVEKVELKIANNVINFIYYLIKKIRKNHISEEDFRFLLYLYDQNICQEYIAIFFRSKSINIIFQSLIKKDVSIINNNLRLLNRSIKNYYLFSYLKNKIFNIKRLCNRFFKPTGLSIAVLGPDGSGKSSLISSLSNEVRFIGRKNKFVHFWPDKNLNKKNIIVQSNPHEKPPYNFFLSFLKLLYCLSRYTVETYFINRFLRIKSTIIWFDRHFIDLLVDPLRYRIKINKKIIYFFLKFVRKPDILIILDVNPNLIRSRVREVSYQETCRQINAYKLICREFDTILLDGNKSIDMTVKEAKFKILKKVSYLNKRIDY